MASVDETWRDIAFASRVLRKSPVFALAAILSLALGIGANTAVFSLFDALVWRPLPVREPQQLVRIGSLENNGMTIALPGAVLDDLRKDPLLQGVCGFTAGDALLGVGENSLVVATHSLSGDCYQTLGVRPAIGRLFTPADDTHNGHKVAVLGYQFWQKQFAGNPNVLGRTIRISGVPFEIIGVTEPRFQGLLFGYPPSVSAPISQRTVNFAQDPTGRFYWAEVLARLRPGVRSQQLEPRLKTEWRRLLDTTLPPGFKGADRKELVSMPPVVTSGANGLDYYFRDHFERSLVVLLGISILVLLVACVNVANLLLARGLQRRREIAIRLAIGAARWRIVRQLLAESALLLAGGFAGALALSLLSIKLVLAGLASAYSRSDLSIAVPIDWRVLLFTSGAAFVAVILFGIFPAWQTSDVDSASALKSASRSLTGPRAGSRRLLLSGQVALTLVILMCADVCAGSLRYLRQNALNFSSDNVLNAQLVPLPRGGLDNKGAVTYLRNLLDGVKSIPGVESVSFSSFAPLVSLPYKEDIRRLDHPDRAVLQAPAEFVTGGFLHIMQIPLLEGRDFRDTETFDSPRTAIVSESVAARLFPRGGAIGRHIQFGSEPETRDVVIIGIVSDAQLEDPHTQNRAFILLSLWQLPRMADWGNLQVRFSGTVAPVTSALREEIRKAGHQQIFLLRTIFGLREVSLLQERLLAAIGRIYGVLTLVLAAVGLFGLLSFFVSARKHEIALRMALGAERRDVTWLVVREAFFLMGAGVLAGLPLSYAGIRGFSSLVYGLAPILIGPVIFSLSLLCAVACVAALVPVYRASSIEPSAVLRQD